MLSPNLHRSPFKVAFYICFLTLSIVVPSVYLCRHSITELFIAQTPRSRINFISSGGHQITYPSFSTLTSSTEATNLRVMKQYGTLPLSFEPLGGRKNAAETFVAHESGSTLLVSSTEAVFSMARVSAEGRTTSHKGSSGPRQMDAPLCDVVRMNLISANQRSRVVERTAFELPGRVNRFVGDKPSVWQTDVPTYSRVRYSEVYPGIDLIYYGNRRQLEYDFVVAPGADPQLIHMAYNGITGIYIDNDGSLNLQTASGHIKQEKPIVYQMINQARKQVAGRYTLDNNHEVGFEIGNYDASKPLVIDPVIVYSTYLGGSADDIGYAVAIDSAGNVYVAGRTLSINFPTANPFRSTNSGLRDIFVSKLNSTGTAILYSTYIGGVGDDVAFAVAVNSSGEAYLTGQTNSTNFPLVGALQPFYGGGNVDAFLVRLSSSGNALITSTYAGGSGTDVGTGIALDNSRNIYGIGYTTSPDLQTVNSIQPFNAGGSDGYLLKLSPSANSIIFSTYAGGSGDDFGNAIAVDSGGYVYAIGDTDSINLTTVNALQPFNAGGVDAFLAKLTPSGTNVVFSTYAGGNGDDVGSGIAIDGTGNIYGVGFTNSTNLQLIVNAVQPIKAAGYDAFVAKLNSTGTAILYSTFLGGNGNDFGIGLNVDTAGNTYIIGETTSSNFPLMNPLQPSNGGARDVFVTKFSSTGSAILFSSYLGGTADDTGFSLAADLAGNTYVTGVTASTNFLTTNPIQPAAQGGLDAFIAKISTLATPTPTPTPTPGPTYSISGRVADGSNNAVSNVTITFELNFQGTVSTRTTLTDSGGNYSFSDSACQNNVKVTPSKTGYSFSPLSMAFVSTGCVSGSNTANFTATPPPPNSVQYSSASYSFGEGGGSATINVTRSGDTSNTLSVNYQTNDNFGFVECNVNNGLANQRCDYITTAGTLNFAANEISKTFTVPIIEDLQLEGNETLNLSLSNPAGGTLGSQSTAVLTISDNDTIASTSRLFVAQLNGAQETPSNNSTATGVGTVLLSSDEMSAQVNLSFNGLSSTQTAAHIHGPAHVEFPGEIVFPLSTGTVNNQTINLTPTQVAQLKAGLFYFNVHTNNFPDGEIRGQILPNPLENARFFVRQQYYDFQNREPDQGGFDYWTNDQITSCGADLACITARRVRVADAFFFEPEFQQTGSYVFRLYRATFGNIQPRANPEILQLPSYAAFIQDRAHVVGGGDLAQKQLALANAFAQRADFLAKYPASLSGPQFVDALLATILTDSGANLSSQRDLLITHFNSGGRGLVLFHLANDYWNTCQSAPCVPTGFGTAVDNRPFLDAEYNRGFVATMYFGFLRRDADIGGFNFWLGQVASFPLRNPVGQHRMVCGALITSQEYQQRFNLYFTRTDAECGGIQ